MKKIINSIFIFGLCLFYAQLTIAQTTFIGTGNPQPILDRSCFDPLVDKTRSVATVAQGGVIGVATTIDSLQLDITHTWNQDLDIFLVGPDGTRLNLSTDNGGTNDNYNNTIFTDGAPPITTGSSPFNGIFSPEGGSFNNKFNGKFAGGDWTLEVCDDENVATGSLKSYSITFSGLQPIQPPVANCTNATVLLDANGMGTLLPSDIDGGSTNTPAACGALDLSIIGQTAYTCADIGNPATVTLQVADFCDTLTCSATITTLDQMAPTAVCPSTPPIVILDANGDGTLFANSLGDGSSTDNCSVTETNPVTNFTCADIGTEVVVLTASNGTYSDTENCNVTIVDGVNPVAVCPSTSPVIALDANGNGILAANALAAGNSTDNCSVMSETSPATNFTCADIGSQTVVLTVSDGTNTDTENCTVTIIDNTAPQITCPANVTVNNDLGLCTAAVGYATPVGTDNCTPTTMQIQGIASGANFPVGTTTNIFEVSDGTNTDQCSFDVTVIDNEAPVFTFCPSDITQGTDAGNCDAVVSYAMPTATDNCVLGVQGMLATPFDQNNGQRGVMFDVTASNTLNINKFDAILYAGTTARYEIYYKAGTHVGSENNAAAWTFLGGANNVTSLGANIPTPLPIPVNVSIPAGQTFAFYITNDFGGGTSYTDGTTVGNLLASNADLTVYEGVGKSYPFGLTFTVRNFNGIIHYGGDLTLTQTQGMPSGSTFAVGTTTQTFTATDGAGNMATCNFDITVNDTENPVAVCQNIDVQLDASNSATLTAAQIDGGSTDNCSVSVSIPATSFDCDDLGAQSVVLTATDLAGNTHTCTATVTVKDDVNPCCAAPTAICSPYTALLDATGNVTISTSDVDGGSTFECGLQSMTIDLMTFDCNDIGTPQNVTLIVTDVNNDSDNCLAVVTIVDNILPTPLCQNITISLDANGNASINASQVDGGSSDACGIATTSISPNTFTAANVGANTVTLTVTDSNGNSNTCTATVTLADITPPNAICQNLTTQLDANGNATVAATAIDNGSTDNAGIASFGLSPTAFDCSNVGANAVVLTVTDVNGNSSTCNATVTIEDNVLPTPLCQNITISLDANGNASINASQVDGGSSDACGIATTSVSPNTFTAANVGANTVTLTVTDSNGNSNTCNATVTLADITPPNAICQNLTTQLDANGNATVAATAIDNGSTDNAGIASFGLSPTAFDCSNVGANAVVLTVTDVNGNSSTCNATVTIEDNVLPNAACQNATAILDATGNASITPQQIGGNSSDACGIASLSLDILTFDCSNVGTPVAVTLTATDNNGNASTCMASITVTDQTPPTPICQPFTAMLDANGVATVTLADVLASASDNCGVQAGGQLTQTLFNCSEQGANTVTVTVTDVNGLSNNCQAVVTVQDNIASVAMCQDLTIQLDATGNTSIIAEDLDNGTTDNCSFTLSASQTDFDCSDLGGNIVILTANDGTNTNTCTSIVTVEDVTAPVANCQNVTIALDENGEASTTANEVDNSSTDACGILSRTLSQTDFDCSHIGQNTVTLSVADASGNESSCSATVTVEDNIPAVILCRPNINTVSEAGLCGANVILLPPLVLEENCSIANITNDAPSPMPVGTTTVEWTLTDAGGNASTCLQNVTINDNEAPEVDCSQPFHAYLSDDPNSQNSCFFPSYDLDLPGEAVDNCGGNVSVSNDAPATFGPGQYIVTWTFTDGNGNATTCEQSVKVWDVTAPTLTFCPDNIVIEATSPEGAEVDWDLPTATDNCVSNNILVLEQNGYQPNDLFPIGATEIGYLVYDQNGQFTECNFTITVTSQSSDLQLFCMDELNISLNGSAGWNILNWNAPLYDTNCEQCDVLVSDDFSFIGSLAGHQYYVQTTDAMTFAQAQTFAENNNATLAILEDKKEVPMIENELPEGDYFIGLIDEEGDGNFVWLDGTPFNEMDFGQYLTNNTDEPAAVILNENGNWEVVSLMDYQANFVFEAICVDLNISIEQNDDDDNEALAQSNTTAEVVYLAEDNCGNVTTCGFEIELVEEAVDYCAITGLDADSEQPFYLETLLMDNQEISTGNDEGYGDYTDYDFTFEPNEVEDFGMDFNDESTDLPIYVRIWIDYNQDGDFFDESELVYQSVAMEYLVANFAIPNFGYDIENTRMRIAISRLTYAESCGDFANGEVEDYTVSILSEESENGGGFGSLLDNQEAGNDSYSMSIYPNPAQEHIFVSVPNEAFAQATLEIYNQLGQLISSQEVATNEATKVNLSDFKTGLYSMTAIVNGEIQEVRNFLIAQ